MKKKDPYKASLERTIKRDTRGVLRAIYLFEKIRKPWFELMEQLLILGALGYLRYSLPGNIFLRIIYGISVGIFYFETLILVKVFVDNVIFKKILHTKIGGKMLLFLYGVIILPLFYYLPNLIFSIVKALIK